MSRSYKKGGGSGRSDNVDHRKVREIVRDTLKHYDIDSDEDVELPEVKMKRKPPIEGGKIQPKWNRGPDKRDIE